MSGKKTMPSKKSKIKKNAAAAPVPSSVEEVESTAEEVESVAESVESTVQGDESASSHEPEEAKNEPEAPKKKSRKTTKRKVHTHETVMVEFDEMLAGLDSEIETMRASPNKIGGIRFLRAMKRQLTSLRSHSLRAMKWKPKRKRGNTAFTGFNKPIPVSKTLAKFAGWDPSELHSRSSVTKLICAYIKEHDLQNPEDRRKILVTKDKKLSKLLGIARDSNTVLTYGSLQTYLAPHFPKVQK